MDKIDQIDNMIQDHAEQADKRLRPDDLVRTHKSAILGVCLAHTRSVHDAEDVMQDVFLKALTKVNTLRDPAKARPWLLKIARRMCCDLYRRGKFAQRLPVDIAARDDDRESVIEELHTAIGKLPPEYRETLCLYYLDGKKCSSIAESLGISPTNARQRLVRARLKLHDLLKEDRK